MGTLEAYQNSVWSAFPNTVVELFVAESFSGSLFAVQRIGLSVTVAMQIDSYYMG